MRIYHKFREWLSSTPDVDTVFHVPWLVAKQKERADMMVSCGWQYLIVVICSILGSFGQFFFKQGSNPFNMIKLLIGLVLYAVATIGFIYALRFEDLHILYPIIALSYVWVTIISRYLLHEQVSSVQWLGIVVIVVGVGLTTWR